MKEQIKNMIYDIECYIETYRHKIALLEAKIRTIEQKLEEMKINGKNM